MSFRPDFDRAARLYVESSIAQHGDVEMARHEAQEWWAIFEEIRLFPDEGWDYEEEDE